MIIFLLGLLKFMALILVLYIVDKLGYNYFILKEIYIESCLKKKKNYYFLCIYFFKFFEEIDY